MYLYQLEALLEGKYLLRMKNMQDIYDFFTKLGSQTPDTFDTDWIMSETTKYNELYWQGHYLIIKRNYLDYNLIKNMQVLKIKHDIDMNLITIGYEKNH